MMSIFVEVQSVDKDCSVIINLDEVIEIAPLVDGGCALFFADGGSAGGRVAYKVKDSYNQFKQFVMQTVSSEDIAKRIESIKKAAAPVDDDVVKSKKQLMKEIPKL